MRIWIVQIGEPTEDDPGRQLMRCGQAALRWAAAGHDVLWWNSDFEHTNKVHRGRSSRPDRRPGGYSILYLPGPGYRRNIGLGRVAHHLASASHFRRIAPTLEPPDIVWTGLPPLETCQAAIDYGRARSIPVLVDTRDLWPDVFLHYLPPDLSAPLRRLAGVALWPMERQLRRICREATGHTAISKTFLSWALAHAGRPPSADDQVAYIGYHDGEISLNSLEDARRSLAALSIRPDLFVVCFFGIFGQITDIDTVLDAADQFHARGDERFQFVLCGDGERREGYVARAAWLPNVVFPGWVDRATIRAVMEVSKVGLIPFSRAASEQGWSPTNKFFEYLAGGLPVLFTPRGEMEDLTAEGGFGVSYRAGDAGDLCRVLEGLADDPDRRDDLAGGARDFYKGRAASLPIYGALLDHLEGVVRRHRSW